MLLVEYEEGAEVPPQVVVWPVQVTEAGQEVEIFSSGFPQRSSYPALYLLSINHLFKRLIQFHRRRPFRRLLDSRD